MTGDDDGSSSLEEELNLSSTRDKKRETRSTGGIPPSLKGQSWTWMSTASNMDFWYVGSQTRTTSVIPRDFSSYI